MDPIQDSLLPDEAVAALLAGGGGGSPYIYEDAGDLVLLVPSGELQVRYGAAKVLKYIFYSNLFICHCDISLVGNSLLNAKLVELEEITTPGATANHGKVYTKNDNKLYFQDGAGVEHEVAFV